MIFLNAKKPASDSHSPANLNSLWQVGNNNVYFIVNNNICYMVNRCRSNKLMG